MFVFLYLLGWGFPRGSAVKNLPTMRVMCVGSLGWEDPLEKEMATHSSILAWRESHGWRSLVGYSPRSCKESDTTEQLHLYLHQGFPGASDSKESACNAGDLGLIPRLGRSPEGGHDNPLQYSCLENPHGQRSLAGYSPWGCTELDMTERLSTAL